jgi:NAD(P)-dependent dehydrogenase (short-subunit alcohol dehydrogenase family)
VALERGEAVAATSRRRADIVKRFGQQDGLLPLQLDVTDPDEARTAVAAAHEHLGEITVVVNNAGYGLIGTIEEVSDD